MSRSGCLRKAILQRLRTWELKLLRRILRVRRVPGEGNFLYNAHASWLEKYTKGDVGAGLLGRARLYRDCAWWDRVKLIPHYERPRTGDVQWKPGPVSCFDDLMVLALGTEWRAKRDNSTRAAWKEVSRECVDLVCDHWGFPRDPRNLPHPGAPGGPQFRGSVSSMSVAPNEKCMLPRLFYNTFGSAGAETWAGTVPNEDGINAGIAMNRHLFKDTALGCSKGALEVFKQRRGPPEKAHPLDHRWADDHWRFNCVVDNQTVAGEVNGLASFTDDRSKDVFQNISQHVLKLVEGRGMKPPRDWDNPVEWRPREYNKRSDAIWNLLLDGSETFDYKDENFEDIISLRPHFLLYTDGGCRKQGNSATGYYVWYSPRSWRWPAVLLR